MQVKKYKRMFVWSNEAKGTLLFKSICVLSKIRMQKRSSYLQVWLSIRELPSSFPMLVWQSTLTLQDWDLVRPKETKKDEN